MILLSTEYTAIPKVRVYQRVCRLGLVKYLIPRLQDEAGSKSWLVQLTYIIARCLLDRVNGVLMYDRQLPIM